MNNPSIDEHVAVFPIPVVDEVKGLVVRILFDVYPDVQSVTEVSRVRQ